MNQKTGRKALIATEPVTARTSEVSVSEGLPISPGSWTQSPLCWRRGPENYIAPCRSRTGEHRRAAQGSHGRHTLSLSEPHDNAPFAPALRKLQRNRGDRLRQDEALAPLADPPAIARIDVLGAKLPETGSLCPTNRRAAGRIRRRSRLWRGLDGHHCLRNSARLSCVFLLDRLV